MVKETGEIRWFNNKKGYGFIKNNADDKDIFVHYSAVNMDGYKTLSTGDKVSFEIVDGDKGKQAANVTVTDAAPITAG